MESLLVAAGVFICLSVASLTMMHFYPRLSLRHRDEETNTVVRLVANIFVVMTSLVFGLFINSAKNTFESIDASIHAYAADIIILDRTLRTYGSGADAARRQLTTYVREAIANPSRSNDALQRRVSGAVRYLDDLGDELAAISPTDRYHETMLADLRQQYHSLLQKRWQIVEQSEGNIPSPLITMLVAWMTLVFASFGYRAPHNPMVVTMLLVSALLFAGSVYLVLDMDIPFSGPIQISDEPLRRALAEIETL
ncbi:bestrophin-like domain [Metapseudomonas resinovorans]|uniref:bestrophin-like domain n=1 Tax=Metapseudomonas resinovorans TaxID=53412 RepID=UPI00040A3CD3|nr:DUF4239 domain-containing protein [Pseudomonas resinovorans]